MTEEKFFVIVRISKAGDLGSEAEMCFTLSNYEKAIWLFKALRRIANQLFEMIGEPPKKSTN